MYKTVKEMAELWKISERTVRNYCANNKIPTAIHKGKAWLIPEETLPPQAIATKLLPAIGIGYQNFAILIEKGLFYIDKTEIIKEWWESGPQVTAIMRPRRFGKTLTLSMLENFFSNQYAQSRLFRSFKIWSYPEYRQLQGKFPVIQLSFAGQKAQTLEKAQQSLRMLFSELYRQHQYLLESSALTKVQKQYFKAILEGDSSSLLEQSVHELSSMLKSHFGVKPLIFLDEYDTPMQEAYLGGYWEELAGFMRDFFNASFKTNPYFEKALMTGITRISKESIFSDLNNIELVTTSSDAYATAFGFTEQEVFAAMDLYGYDNKSEVKSWYDGFTFGKYKEIYNPWSITNFLHTGKLQAYWVNSSSNSLINQLIYEGSNSIKQSVEKLITGGTIETFIDEQVYFGQLPANERAIWSLLLATGYLKIIKADYELLRYTLALTNKEVQLMLERMISGWFANGYHGCNGFVRALLENNLGDMQDYLEVTMLDTVSYFDAAKNPEAFYHGLVLGMILELKGKYLIRSNRESGFGRYDIVLEPVHRGQAAYILEFKVCREENKLQDTATSALEQIRKQRYAQELIAQGQAESNIYCYGLAFYGKRVHISR